MTGDITCVGTFARVTVFQVERLHLRGYGEETTVSTLDGNDAVIAARLLAAQGTSARCVLADPSTSDIDAVRSGSPASLSLTTVGARPGPVTAAACLRSRDGSRYWLLPPAARTISGVLPDLGDGLAYADVYDEFEQWLPGQLARAGAGARLVLNLSSSGQQRKARRVSSLRPYLVQASIPGARSPGQLTRAAQSLREAASATCAAVTAGPAGAVLATRIRRYFSRPEHLPERTRIGAGAAFASGLLEALRDSEDWEAALDRAARVARAWLAGRHAPAPEAAA